MKTSSLVRLFKLVLEDDGDENGLEPGTCLKGFLMIKLRATVHCRDISIYFEGRTETEIDGDRECQQLFYVHLPLLQYLQKCNLSDGRHQLPAGDHTLPFVFPLPINLPSSFSGTHGYIDYRCHAKMIITSQGQTEFMAETVFQVKAEENLNWHPYAIMPISWHDSYRQRLLCFTKANVSVVLRLTRAGFLPGDTIDFSIEIVNDHARNVCKGCRVELIERVQYQCEGRSRITRTTLCAVNKPPIAPKSVQITNESDHLHIPEALVASFLRHSPLITVHYDVVCILNPGIRFAIPIIVGNRPFDAVALQNIVQALPWKKPDQTMIENNNQQQQKRRGIIGDLFFSSSKSSQLSTNDDRLSSNRSSNPLINAHHHPPAPPPTVAIVHPNRYYHQQQQSWTLQANPHFWQSANIEQHDSDDDRQAVLTIEEIQ